MGIEQLNFKENEKWQPYQKEVYLKEHSVDHHCQKRTLSKPNLQPPTRVVTPQPPQQTPITEEDLFLQDSNTEAIYYPDGTIQELIKWQNYQDKTSPEVTRKYKKISITYDRKGNKYQTKYRKLHKGQKTKVTKSIDWMKGGSVRKFGKKTPPRIRPPELTPIGFGLRPTEQKPSKYQTTSNYIQKAKSYLQTVKDRDFGKKYAKEWKTFNKKLREYQHQKQYMNALGWLKPQQPNYEQAKALGLIEKYKQLATSPMIKTAQAKEEMTKERYNKIARNAILQKAKHTGIKYDAKMQRIINAAQFNPVYNRIEVPFSKVDHTPRYRFTTIAHELGHALTMKGEFARGKWAEWDKNLWLETKRNLTGTPVTNKSFKGGLLSQKPILPFFHKSDRERETQAMAFADYGADPAKFRKRNPKVAERIEKLLGINQYINEIENKKINKIGKEDDKTTIPSYVGDSVWDGGHILNIPLHSKTPTFANIHPRVKALQEFGQDITTSLIRGVGKAAFRDKKGETPLSGLEITKNKLHQQYMDWFKTNFRPEGTTRVTDPDVLASGSAGLMMLFPPLGFIGGGAMALHGGKKRFIDKDWLDKDGNIKDKYKAEYEIGLGVIPYAGAAYKKLPLQYWLSEKFPFRADKIILMEKVSQARTIINKPKGTVSIPKNPVKAHILGYTKRTGGTLGGGRSIDAHGIELSRYPKGKIATSDFDIYWKTKTETSARVNQLGNELNQNFGKNRFEIIEPTENTINWRIRDRVTGDHYDFIPDNLPYTEIGGYKVLDITRQTYKKGEALRNPLRVHRGYDPETRIVKKDFTDFVDIVRQTVNNKINPKFFLKESAKDYTVYNRKINKLEVDTSKIPIEHKRILNKKGIKKNKIELDEYTKIIKDDKPYYEPINENRAYATYEKAGRYYSELPPKYSTGSYYSTKDSTKLPIYYKGIVPPKYPTYPKAPYPETYTAGYAPTYPTTTRISYPPTYSPTVTTTKRPLIIPTTIPPSKPPTKMGKRKEDKQVSGKQPIFYNNRGKKQFGAVYETQFDAMNAGMETVDKTPYTKFQIRNEMEDASKIRKHKTYKKNYKFKQIGKTTKERRYYQFDSRGERNGNFNIFQFI